MKDLLLAGVAADRHPDRRVVAAANGAFVYRSLNTGCDTIALDVRVTDGFVAAMTTWLNGTSGVHSKLPLCVVCFHQPRSQAKVEVDFGRALVSLWCPLQRLGCRSATSRRSWTHLFTWPDPTRSWRRLDRVPEHPGS